MRLFFHRLPMAALLGVYLLGPAGASWAQPNPQDVTRAAEPVPGKGAADAQGFALGLGDVIALSVVDLDELSGKTVRIDTDGGFDLPLVGRVQAVGLTLAQLRTLLASKLSRFITSPQISINLTESQNRAVSVIGEVNSPGVHQLQGPKSLVEVISMAGGLRGDAGPRVVLTREAQWGPLPLTGAVKDSSGRFTTATLSLDELLAAKNPADNITIMPDDVVSVPKGEIVYVVGEVHRAGGFPLASHENMSILQALALAEGTNPTAATKRAKILRPLPGNKGTPQEIPVDVKNIFAGKAPDVPLYANDILFIPNSAAKSGSRRAIEAVLQVATGAAIYAR